MEITLQDYQEVVGPGVIEELRVLAERVRDRRMQHINSTSVGGGVAEILTRMMPLLRELGVSATWDVIKGDQAFFNVTKAFHNALHGKAEEITAEMYQIFRSTTEMNLAGVNLSGDVIFIHDPQPAGLIQRKKEAPRGWVWRCHIDVSTPQPAVWNFLRPYIEQYDAAIFSMPDFAQQLPQPQFRIAPSIDPLSDKNRPLDGKAVESVFKKYHVDPDVPLLTQISRFDRLKDPLGVIAAYRMVRRRHKCQLVLAGGGAPDDPEGEQVLHEVQEAAADDPDIHVLLLPPFSDLEINALVRGSTVVMQKSIREGFGLTVSEALWKKKPVIGSAVGGIKLQVIDGVTGFLVHSIEGAANRVTQLLSDRKLCERMGENGFAHVKQNFLVTRQVKDYLLTMLALEHPRESVVHLN
ncbi:MAG: glycosyl transferase family 1 [Acidobacteria bacterium]|nr:MAG: glycosyl transferase family 1 [Acidobacteriota bacterium]